MVNMCQTLLHSKQSRAREALWKGRCTEQVAKFTKTSGIFQRVGDVTSFKYTNLRKHLKTEYKCGHLQC